MRFRSAIAVAAVAAVALAAAATAAPDKTATLTASSPQFAWDGETGQYSFFSLAPVVPHDSADCSKDADSYCEQILLDVRSSTPVKLDVSLTEFTNAAADFDLYVHKSDQTGKLGEEVEGGDGTGGSAGEDEIWTAEELEPGYYLAVVVHFFNPEASYKGMAKVTGATPTAGEASPPPPGAGGTPPPPLQPGAPSQTPTTLPFKAKSTLGSARKAKKKQSLSFKATAGADIANLKLGLFDSRKRPVTSASIASFKKGTRTVKLKVRKLKAGKYTLAAEGFVSGRLQRTSQVVRVKK